MYINLTPVPQAAISFAAYCFAVKTMPAGARRALESIFGRARGRRTSRSLHKLLLFIVMKDQAGRRHQIPGEHQIPEFQILLLKLDNGDSLITFSGNLPDSAFPGSTRWLSRRTVPQLTVFDFVLGCKLSPLLSRPCSARQCRIAYSFWLLNNSCVAAREAGDILGCAVSMAHWGGVHCGGAWCRLPLFSY